MRIRKFCALLALLPLLLPGAAPAEAPRVHALTGVRIVVAPGRVIESGTVVLRDGLIEAAGPEVTTPADARVWEREGMTVYSGLIDPYTSRPAPAREDDEAPPQGGHDNPLVRPEIDATTFAVKEDSVKKLREAGYTTALVAPAGGLFRGRSVLINLGDGGANANLLRRGVAQHAGFSTNDFGGGYPSSVMGSVALFRQTLLDAAWYATAWQAYGRRPGQERPSIDTALEALGGVAAGGEILVIETDDPLDSLRAIRLAKDLGLSAWLVGNGSEYQWLDPIAAAGLPHLLPLDFPKDPAVSDDDDLALGLDELRHWDEAPANPKRLLDAGVTVAFTTHRLAEPKRIHEQLVRAVEAGLSPDQALAAVTTTPARLLGIAAVAGTVEAGKQANLVVVEGDLFVKDSKIREVWIDGRRYEVKESKPPEVEPQGTWEMVVETGDGQRLPATLVLSGEAPSLQGMIGSQDQTVELSSAEVSGSAVEVSFDGTSFGIPGTITFTIEIDGDSAAGSGTAPMGPFTISGTRTSKPEVAS